jgi:ribonuclease P protein component
MTRFTLAREERLSSLRDIEALFKEGKSLTKYPVRLVWRVAAAPGTYPVSIVFSVSKKKFPRAVDRNRIKRLLRENYRLLKPDFYERIPNGMHFHVGLIYTGREIPDHAAIQRSLAIALEKLILQVAKK